MSVGLSFNIDLDTGLEFQDEVVCEDGNLLNEFFDQSLITPSCDIGFLPGDEVLQFHEPTLNTIREACFNSLCQNTDAGIHRRHLHGGAFIHLFTCRASAKEN